MPGCSERVGTRLEAGAADKHEKLAIDSGQEHAGVEGLGLRASGLGLQVEGLGV